MKVGFDTYNYSAIMRKLTVVFFLTFNLNFHGQEIHEDPFQACGAQLDVKNNNSY